MVDKFSQGVNCFFALPRRETMLPISRAFSCPLSICEALAVLEDMLV
jgi:hypothetical protein